MSVPGIYRECFFNEVYMTQSDYSWATILSNSPRSSYPQSNAEFFASLTRAEAIRLAEKKLELYEGSDFTIAQISEFTGCPRELLEAAADAMLNRALAGGV